MCWILNNIKLIRLKSKTKASAQDKEKQNTFILFTKCLVMVIICDIDVKILLMKNYL